MSEVPPHRRPVLWRIEAPYFVAGLIVHDHVVIEAAPILWWARAKRWAFVRAELRRRGFHGTLL